MEAADGCMHEGSVSEICFFVAETFGSVPVERTIRG
jgi:hypothetical protein